MFGATEHSSSGLERAKFSRARLGDWLDARQPLPGVVLSTPGAVAWLTGGISAPVDRTAATDLAWAIVTPRGAHLVTTEVEGPRILDEYDPAAHGFDEVVQVPWWDASAFVTAAETITGAPAAELASDGHPAFGSDVSEELVTLRLALSVPEQDAMRVLGRDAAAALQVGLRSWTPGERDLDVQARIGGELEAAGADAPVLIVGGDDRVRRFRHPMASGAPMHEFVMAVVVARRDGLHAAATRFASAGPLDPELSGLRARALRIDRDVLATSRPGATYGEVLAVLDAGYVREGHTRGWAAHYQGGPIGYAQREFELAPCQTDDARYGQALAAGHAVAWNPSLPGGAKVEDTYLVTEHGLDRVTDADDWPSERNDEVTPARPAVLDVAA